MTDLSGTDRDDNRIWRKPNSEKKRSGFELVFLSRTIKNSNASCNLKTVNITEVMNGTRKAKFFLEPKIRHEHESLILAQDERWRRA